MKKAILVLLMSTGLSACGITDDMNKRCTGSDLESICTFVFGGTDREQQAQIDQGLKESEFALNARIKNLEMLVTFLNYANESQDINNAAYISSLQAEINQTQLDVISLQTDLTELATGDTVVEMIDPCGASPGYNEVLLRTGSGKNVAYFEQGSKRFLSVIGQGSYQTTDASACSFTVNSLGQVCSLKASVMVCE